MDKPVRWSPEAIADLESIAEYIGRDSSFYSGAVVSKVLGVARSLAERPLLGRCVPEIDREEIRERFVYSYRLVYRLDDNEITVVAVIHGKRLIDNFAERLDE